MQLSLPVRWAVDISRWQPDQSDWQSLLEPLPTDIRAEVDKFKQKSDQQRALISRLLQRKAASDCLSVPISQVEIKRTKGGKPFCTNSGSRASASNFNFNVSHEGDYIVLAAEATCICGIDVAAPAHTRSSRLQTPADLHKSFQKQLTSYEWDCVDSAGDLAAQMGMFQKFWSLKEAFVKARGDGLGFDLGKAEFHLGPMQVGLQDATVSVDGQTLTRWKFYVHSLGRGHIVSVALGPPEDVVDAWGEFKNTFCKPHMTTTDIQAAHSEPEPAFSLLDIPDLMF